MDKTAYFEQMRQRRRTEILDAARKMILAQGIDNFNIQQLSRDLDISTVTLYKYFKNSEDIMLALQEQIIEAQPPFPVDCGINPDQCGENPLDLFFELHRVFYEKILANRENVTLLALFDVYLRNKPSANEGHQAFSDYITQISGFLFRLLKDAKAKGLISPSLNLEETFRFLCDLNIAFIRQIGLMGDEEFARRKALLQKQTEQLLNLSRLTLMYQGEV